MKKFKKGSFKNGIHYVVFGSGSSILVIFTGGWRIEILSGRRLEGFIELFDVLVENYLIYLIDRKNDLKEGYTTRDMAEDYATIIRDELEEPVDVLGLSLGGLIAQYLVLNYPNLVQHVILGMAAYRIGDEGKKLNGI